MNTPNPTRRRPLSGGRFGRSPDSLLNASHFARRSAVVLGLALAAAVPGLTAAEGTVMAKPGSARTNSTSPRFRAIAPRRFGATMPSSDSRVSQARENVRFRDRHSTR